MRTLLLAIPALLMLTPNAGAQSTDYPARESAMSTVRVAAPPQSYRALRDEPDFASGKYQMSNGWFLTVEATPYGIRATIDRERTMRLIAVGPNRYVTPSGNVAMDFNRGEHGDEMLMSYVPGSNLAAVIVVRTTLASR